MGGKGGGQPMYIPQAPAAPTPIPEAPTIRDDKISDEVDRAQLEQSRKHTPNSEDRTSYRYMNDPSTLGASTATKKPTLLGGG